METMSRLCLFFPGACVSAQQATVQVSTFEELDAALRKTPLQPIIVMNDIGLDRMLPNISGSLVISGNPATCAKSEVRRLLQDSSRAVLGMALQSSLRVSWTHGQLVPQK